MLKAHDLSSIARTSLERSERNEENEEMWVELISWKPRAFFYHNFLLSQVFIQRILYGGTELGREPTSRSPEAPIRNRSDHPSEYCIQCQFGLQVGA